MLESCLNDRGSRHDVGKLLKRKGEPDTMPKSRRNDRESGHDAGELAKIKVDPNTMLKSRRKEKDSDTMFESH